MRARTVVGIVRRWDERGRFGFIQAGGADFFTHPGCLVEPRTALRPGELVEFIAATSARGPRALRVRRIPGGTCPKCDTPLSALVCSACGLQLGT